MNSRLIALTLLAFGVATASAQTRHSRFHPSKDYWDWANNKQRAPVHYTHISNRRTLVDVGDTLYMLDRRKQVLWVWKSGGPPLHSPPFVDSSGSIYMTGDDLTWVAIDSKTGDAKWTGSANGRASYSPIIPFKGDAYFVVAYMGAYRSDGGGADQVTLCRGNSIFWTSEIPSTTRLRVRRGKAFLVTRRNQRTILTALAVPDKLNKPIGKVSALAPYN